MKYIKLFESYSHEYYGYYSIANVNQYEILKKLDNINIPYKHDEYTNCIEIEFCGEFIGYEERKMVLIEIVNSLPKKDSKDYSKDDTLIVLPVKFH